jgi:EAL domain-containing protein (putative c-di-GMP-specific phosphodiesterase class I)
MLNLAMIAVGIETAAQQFPLAELGCASLQGFHLGIAMLAGRPDRALQPTQSG